MVSYRPVPGRLSMGHIKERSNSLHSRTFLEVMIYKPVTVTQNKVRKEECAQKQSHLIREIG